MKHPDQRKRYPLSIPLAIVLACASHTSKAQTQSQPQSQPQTISDNSSLPEINVKSSRFPNASEGKKSVYLGALGEKEFLDVPYSVTTLDREVVSTRQMKSFREMLRPMPSVQWDAGRLQSRGFQGSVVHTTFLDGLNIATTTDYPAEQFERVEVLNGMGGALFGPATPSGFFNFVSKRPLFKPHQTYTLGTDSGASTNVTADINGAPIGPDGKIGYRFNYVGETGDAYTANSTRRRQLLSLAVDWRLAPSTIIETNVSRYRYEVKGLPGAFSAAVGVDLPSAMDPTNQHFGQSYAGEVNTTTTGSIFLRHVFDNQWRLDLGYLRQIADREYTAVSNGILNARGDYTTTSSQTTGSRFVTDSYLATLGSRLTLGSTKHDVLVGIRAFYMTAYNPVNGRQNTLGSANLANPQPFAAPRFPDFTDRYKAGENNQLSFILGDAIEFSPRWSAQLSASASRLSTFNYKKTGETSDSGRDFAWSGAASLIYKVTPNASVYATYANSIQQGQFAPAGAINANQITAPYRGKQYEIGAKVQHADVNYSLSLFEMTRPFAFLQANRVFDIAGEQRNRGLEIMADGRVTKHLRIYGGATWLDPRLSKTASKTTEDKQIVGLSRFTASMMMDYQLPWLPEAAVNASVYHAGRSAGNGTNTSWISGYTTFDAGASYKMRMGGVDATWRLQVTNLTNQRYWTGIRPGGLVGYTGAGNVSAQLGAPRAVLATVQIDY